MVTQSYKTIGEWIHRSFLFENIEIEKVKFAFTKVLQEHRFRVKEEINIADGFEIRALYGAKAKAFFTGRIIPFGEHLPWGKRFFLKARFKSVAENTEMLLDVSPHMELFNSEEIGFITQDVTEKFTDDYMAASKLHSIAQCTYYELGIEIPESLLSFKRKQAATDALWNVLIYPVDGYKNPRKIHIPPVRNRTWSWGAFFIPQIWFLYYDAWGVAALSLFTDPIAFYIGSILIGWISPVAGLLVGFVLILLSRCFYALNFEKIHYARHGRWRNG